MKRSLEAIQGKLIKLLEQANKLSISDNEDIASKYSDIASSIDSALGEIDLALAALE